MTETTELVRDGWYQVITAFPDSLTTVAYRYESGGWSIPDPTFNEASLVGARITPLYTRAEIVDELGRAITAAERARDESDYPESHVGQYKAGRVAGLELALERLVELGGDL